LCDGHGAMVVVGDGAAARAWAAQTQADAQNRHSLCQKRQLLSTRMLDLIV
jgi:hypothetical protein